MACHLIGLDNQTGVLLVEIGETRFKRRTWRGVSFILVHILPIWNIPPHSLSVIHRTADLRFLWRTKLVYILALFSFLFYPRAATIYCPQVRTVTLGIIWCWLLFHASMWRMRCCWMNCALKTRRAHCRIVLYVFHSCMFIVCQVNNSQTRGNKW